MTTNDPPRDELFAPFHDFDRLNRLTARDVKHHSCQAPSIIYSSLPLDEAKLRVGERLLLAEIRHRAHPHPEMTVVARLHVAECHCCREIATQPSAMIEVEWEGRKLTRERHLVLCELTEPYP